VDKIGEPQPLTPERELEIRKQNQRNQSWAVRDLLHEVERLKELTERPCTDDEPCECCRINTEVAEKLQPDGAPGILDILQSGVVDRAEYWEKRSHEVEEKLAQALEVKEAALRQLAEAQKERDVARGVENLERIRADKATWACEQLEARLKDDAGT